MTPRYYVINQDTGARLDQHGRQGALGPFIHAREGDELDECVEDAIAARREARLEDITIGVVRSDQWRLLYGGS